MFLEKGVLKICSKFTGEHPCWSAISTKLLCIFIEVALLHECSPANLLNILRTPFLRNTSGWLLLPLQKYINKIWLFLLVYRNFDMFSSSQDLSFPFQFLLWVLLNTKYFYLFWNLILLILLRWLICAAQKI